MAKIHKTACAFIPQMASRPEHPGLTSLSCTQNLCGTIVVSGLAVVCAWNSSCLQPLSSPEDASAHLVRQTPEPVTAAPVRGRRVRDTLPKGTLPKGPPSPGTLAAKPAFFPALMKAVPKQSDAEEIFAFTCARTPGKGLTPAPSRAAPKPSCKGHTGIPTCVPTSVERLLLALSRAVTENWPPKAACKSTGCCTVPTDPSLARLPIATKNSGLRPACMRIFCSIAGKESGSAPRTAATSDSPGKCTSTPICYVMPPKSHGAAHGTAAASDLSAKRS